MKSEIFLYFTCFISTKQLQLVFSKFLHQLYQTEYFMKTKVLFFQFLISY